MRTWGIQNIAMAKYRVDASLFWGKLWYVVRVPHQYTTDGIPTVKKWRTYLMDCSTRHKFCRYTQRTKQFPREGMRHTPNGSIINMMVAEIANMNIYEVANY